MLRCVDLKDSLVVAGSFGVDEPGAGEPSLGHRRHANLRLSGGAIVEIHRKGRASVELPERNGCGTKRGRRTLVARSWGVHQGVGPGICSVRGRHVGACRAVVGLHSRVGVACRRVRSVRVLAWCGRSVVTAAPDPNRCQTDAEKGQETRPIPTSTFPSCSNTQQCNSEPARRRRRSWVVD
jgi:hypothetical protein